MEMLHVYVCIVYYMRYFSVCFAIRELRRAIEKYSRKKFYSVHVGTL